MKDSFDRMLKGYVESSWHLVSSRSKLIFKDVF
jgi:hypothetical protein